MPSSRIIFVLLSSFHIEIACLILRAYVETSFFPPSNISLILFTVFVELLHFSYGLLQSLRHEEGSLAGAVVALEVLEEAQKERVDGHVINAEESVGDEIRPNDDHHDRREDVVQRGNFITQLRDVTAEEEVREAADAHDDDDLAQEEDKVDGAVEHHHPEKVAHEQIEGRGRRRAERGALHRAHDVRVLVDVPHKLFQTPETAFAAAEEAPREVVVELFELGLDVFDDGADHADDGDDE